MVSFQNDPVEPDSVEEAKEHIDQIREDYGLGDVSRGFAQDSLREALKMYRQISSSFRNVGALTYNSLANELYSESTHFIHELIQNANDNEFSHGVVPELKFEYKSGFLRVDCNEIGFKRKHVNAICRIGKSTKSGENKKDGAIGEKGIGFKSVFKVADVVWITSRQYSFKFETDKAKHKGLGMIAPIWSEPPDGFSARRGVTSFYLRLSSANRQCEVQAKLNSVDATMLMFLRKLRRITITMEGGTPRVLNRTESNSAFGRIITLHQDNEMVRYVSTKYTVCNLPETEKRPGIEQSEVELAFPITRQETPLIKQQQVFAHLPMRPFGFQVWTLLRVL
jgi:hypothetical protein